MDTNIPSEICNSFNKNRLPLVVSNFNKLVESLHLGNTDLGGHQRENCQLTNLQVFQLLVLLPFFSVVNTFNYSESVLSKMFGGKKDMLYSFISQDNIDWRNIIYRVTVRCISNVTCRQDYKKRTLPSVLIADGTTFPSQACIWSLSGRSAPICTRVAFWAIRCWHSAQSVKARSLASWGDKKSRRKGARPNRKAKRGEIQT